MTQPPRAAPLLLVLAIVAVGCAAVVGTGAAALTGIHKIQHVILIVQENRSFDSYFGTYRGADGIPMRRGVPTECVPDPRTQTCVKPFHDPSFVNEGGPHAPVNAANDVNGGPMNGFVRSALEGHHQYCALSPFSPDCTNAVGRVGHPDVMGWHDAREIPNYWAYAKQFVLQDHMFESVRSWSLPSHLAMVSGWSATCSVPGDPMSCYTDLGQSTRDSTEVTSGNLAPYSWTDITYLLHRAGVSWAYYVAQGTQPDCENGAMFCAPEPQSTGTPEIWNPLPDFQTVQEDGQVGNIQPVSQYLQAAALGTLPAVSWIAPDGRVSEHPPGSIRAGQAWVTRLIDAAMNGPDWNSTAIFLTWDDWGGFYDHVVPPTIDGNQYGLRVPGLVISPYAKQGYIDHQTLSFDAYLKFIEDDFLGGERLNPQTDGRPDSRPTVREAAEGLGNLASDFNFSRPPRPPLILRPFPRPGPASIAPRPHPRGHHRHCRPHAAIPTERRCRGSQPIRP